MKLATSSVPSLLRRYFEGKVDKTEVEKHLAEVTEFLSSKMDAGKVDGFSANDLVSKVLTTVPSELSSNPTLSKVNDWVEVGVPLLFGKPDPSNALLTPELRTFAEANQTGILPDLDLNKPLGAAVETWAQGKRSKEILLSVARELDLRPGDVDWTKPPLDVALEMVRTAMQQGELVSFLETWSTQLSKNGTDGAIKLATRSLTAAEADLLKNADGLSDFQLSVKGASELVDLLGDRFAGNENAILETARELGLPVGRMDWWGSAKILAYHAVKEAAGVRKSHALVTALLNKTDTATPGAKPKVQFPEALKALLTSFDQNASVDMTSKPRSAFVGELSQVYAGRSNDLIQFARAIGLPVQDFDWTGNADLNLYAAFKGAAQNGKSRALAEALVKDKWDPLIDQGGKPAKPPMTDGIASAVKSVNGTLDDLPAALDPLIDQLGNIFAGRMDEVMRLGDIAKVSVGSVAWSGPPASNFRELFRQAAIEGTLSALVDVLVRFS